MKTVILCGGMGTRIRDASENLPKPLLPIGGRPILWHIMKGYAHYGFKDFVLCLGYKGWLIKEFFLNYQRMSSDLLVTLGPRGTTEFMGAVAGRRLAGDPGRHRRGHHDRRAAGGRPEVSRGRRPRRCCTYGDGVADIDVKQLVAFHRSHGKIATVTAVRPPGTLRRAVDRRRAGHRVQREAAGHGRASSTAASSSSTRVESGTTSTADPDLHSREREPMRALARDRPAGRLRAHRVLAADGHPARVQPLERALVFGARPLEGVDVSAYQGILARPSDSGHRRRPGWSAPG